MELWAKENPTDRIFDKYDTKFHFETNNQTITPWTTKQERITFHRGESLIEINDIDRMYLN